MFAYYPLGLDIYGVYTKVYALVLTDIGGCTLKITKLVLTLLMRAIGWLFGVRVARKSFELPAQKEVAVLIPAYKEADILPTTLNALKAQTFGPSRVIVIDDGSSDDTAKIARQCGCEVVRLENRSGSKAKAINRVLERLKLTADYIAVIDADTILAKDALEKALGYFTRRNVAAVCGYVLSGQIRTFWQKARAVEYIVGGALDKGAQEWWGVPLIMAGCFTVWRAELLLRQGFPERSFTEDLDLTWSLISQGFRVVYASEARCWTIDPHNWSTYRAQLLRWRRGFLQNMALHWRNWIRRPRMAFFILWWLIGGSVLATIYLAAVVWLLLSQNWLWFGMLAGGELAYLSLAILTQGRRLGYPWRVTGYALHYWLAKPASLYLFWEALVRELWETSQQKRSLTWEKTRKKGVTKMYQPPGVPIGGLLLRLPILAILTIALLVAPRQVAQEVGATLNGELPEASITFTFDDGWKSVYKKAFPLLEKCGAVGTVFVVTDQVGLPAFMSWQELSGLYQKGWEIGSHGVTHRDDLTTLSDEELAKEISDSKARLEQEGFKVFSFASPFGAYNKRTLKAIGQLYLAHRTTDSGLNYRPMDPYRIKSFDANQDGLEDLNKAFSLILKAKHTHGHLVLTFHKIDQEGEPSSYPAWKLEALCQYAKAQGFRLFKMTSVQ